MAVQLPSDGVSWEGESPDRVVGGARQEETRPSHNSESSKIDLISDTEPSKRRCYKFNRSLFYYVFTDSVVCTHRFQSAADSSSPAIYGGDLFLSQTIEESADVASKSDEILELKAVAMATFSSFATDDDEINIDAPLTAAASHSQTESRIEKGSELNCAGSSKVNEDEHIDNHIFLETVEFTPLIASPPAYKSTPKIGNDCSHNFVLHSVRHQYSLLSYREITFFYATINHYGVHRWSLDSLWPHICCVCCHDERYGCLVPAVQSPSGNASFSAAAKSN